MARFAFVSLAAAAIICGLCQCSSSSGTAPAEVVVSVREQKLAVYDGNGSLDKKYAVSTSKYGLSDRPGTYGTPLGMLEVVAKIGHGAPPGAVFKNRRQTGEVIKPDSPGRDPIVSRIMWLRGLEPGNKNAYGRGIYIHGTPEERYIGQPASYGCIRMKSRDVIELFAKLPIGSRVLITEALLPASVPVGAAPRRGPAPSSRPPLPLNPDAVSEQPVVLAQNNAGSSRRGASASQRAAAATTSASSAYQTRQTSDGSTVIYNSPGGSPPMVLKSRRSASQSLNNN